MNPEEIDVFSTFEPISDHVFLTFDLPHTNKQTHFNFFRNTLSSVEGIFFQFLGFFLSMIYPFFFIIHLLIWIYYYSNNIRSLISILKKSVDYFSFSYKNTANVFIKNDQMPIHCYNLLFISIFIVFFLICVYYQRSLINYIFTRVFITKKNNNNVNTKTNGWL